MDVAVVERFKLEPMYRLSAGQKKVAIVERWLLEGWFDCIYLSFLFQIFAINDFPREGSLIISRVINRSFKILNCKLSLISRLKSVIPILTG